MPTFESRSFAPAKSIAGRLGVISVHWHDAGATVVFDDAARPREAHASLDAACRALGVAKDAVLDWPRVVVTTRSAAEVAAMVAARAAVRDVDVDYVRDGRGWPTDTVCVRISAADRATLKGDSMVARLLADRWDYCDEACDAARAVFPNAVISCQ